MVIKQKNIEIKNKRAWHDYFVLDAYTAGIVLTGTEIKSIRQGKAGLADTYCYVRDREMWVKNMYVAEYFYGSYNNHVSRRDRKLLLNKREITRLEQEGRNAGLSIVPIKLYIDENSRAKLEIALVKGKKEYDKRQALREKEDRRAMAEKFKEQRTRRQW